MSDRHKSTVAPAADSTARVATVAAPAPDSEAVVSLMDDSIDFMPLEEKQAYIKACQQCPTLVQEESNPLDFLHFEDFDLWKASRRLVKYWEWRVHIFGEERAFRPILDLTGNGAMDEIDLQILASAAIVVLPSHHHSTPTSTTPGTMNSPRDAVAFRNMCNERYGDFLLQNPKRIQRRSFYFADLVRHNFKVQQGVYKGSFGLLSFLNEQPPFWILNKTSWARPIQEGIPIELKWIRYIIASKNIYQELWFNSFYPLLRSVLLQQRRIIQRQQSQDELIQVDVWAADGDIKQKLALSGLYSDALPPCLGGTWSYQNYYIWLATETAKQQQPSSTSAVINTTTTAASTLVTVSAAAAAATTTNCYGDDNNNFDLQTVSNMIPNITAITRTTTTVAAAGATEVSAKPSYEHAVPLGSANYVSCSSSSMNSAKQLHTQQDPGGQPIITATAQLQSQQPSKHSNFGGGCGGPFSSPSSSLLLDAIELIPLPEKISFVRGKNDAPVIHADESYPTLFLLYHESNAIQAAQHLVSYWALREKLFSDRAFLYTNQVGTGTLNKIDLKTLSTGFLMIISQDTDGHSVVVYDPSKSIGCTIATQRRCFFYILFLAMVESVSIPKGNTTDLGEIRVIPTVTFLIKVSKDEAENSHDKRIFADVIGAFPINIGGFHVVLESEGLIDNEYRDKVVSKLNKTFGLQSDQLFIHTVLAGMDICDELSIYGIRPECIPSALGGKWSMDSFLKWQENLKIYEQCHRSLSQPKTRDISWAKMQAKMWNTTATTSSSSRSAGATKSKHKAKAAADEANNNRKRISKKDEGTSLFKFAATHIDGSRPAPVRGPSLAEDELTTTATAVAVPSFAVKSTQEHEKNANKQASNSEKQHNNAQQPSTSRDRKRKVLPKKQKYKKIKALPEVVGESKTGNVDDESKKNKNHQPLPPTQSNLSYSIRNNLADYWRTQFNAKADDIRE